MTETLTRIEVNCTTEEVQEVPLTPDEITQRDLDIAASIQRRADQDVETTRIEGIKTSIAAKRMSATWIAFTQEETDYLTSRGL